MPHIIPPKDTRGLDAPNRRGRPERNGQPSVRGFRASAVKQRYADRGHQRAKSPGAVGDVLDHGPGRLHGNPKTTPNLANVPAQTAGWYP